MIEKWKQINEFPNYEISNLGRIKFTRIIKPNVATTGYEKIYFYHNGERKKFSVSRLVAEYFIKNDDKKPQVNHKNGNKLDNTVNNLEWVTGSENVLHAYKNGLITANRHGNDKFRKLTWSDVIFIRVIDGMKDVEIAKIFGVDRKTIREIRNFVTWKINK